MGGARVTVAGQLLLGRALPLARPRLWLLSPWQMARDPGSQGKGVAASKVPTFLSLGRYPGLLRVSCLSWAGAGTAALELRAQQDVLNTGKSWAVVMQWRGGLIVPLSEHTTAIFHSFIFSIVLCAYGR